MVLASKQLEYLGFFWSKREGGLLLSSSEHAKKPERCEYVVSLNNAAQPSDMSTRELFSYVSFEGPVKPFEGLAKCMTFVFT